jgi:hypothetical protein
MQGTVAFESKVLDEPPEFIRENQQQPDEQETIGEYGREANR